MSKKAVTLNIEELKDFAKHIIDNNRYLQKNNKFPVAINIVGEAGIGKTSSLMQLAEELNLNIVKINLAQIEELSDLVGFPVRQFEMSKEGDLPVAVPTAKVIEKVPIKKVVKVQKEVPVTKTEIRKVEDFEIKITKKQVLEDGKFVLKEIENKVPKLVEKEVEVTVMELQEVEEEVETFEEVEKETTTLSTAVSGNSVWVDEQFLEEYRSSGYKSTGRKRMSYCPPEWIAGKENGGILLLDDWTRADARFLQAVMDLIDRQQYISWSLPKDWHIMLSSNPDNGDYFVSSIDPAQKTRFISVEMAFDVDVWAKWAEQNGIDGRGINFLLKHPEFVNQLTNPRSITTFFNSISSLNDFEKSLPLIQMIAEGSVGPEFATTFTMFINNRLDKLLSPKDILLNPSTVYIINELRNSIGTKENYRADIASILSTRIINYSLHYAENNQITQEIIDRIIALTTEEELFNNDIQYLMIKKILNGNKVKFQKLIANPVVMAMTLK